MEERLLLPYVTPKEVENGELEFDRQILLYDGFDSPRHHAFLLGCVRAGPSKKT